MPGARLKSELDSISPQNQVFCHSCGGVPNAFGTEPFENTGFRLENCRNDREQRLVYGQTLIKLQKLTEIKYKHLFSFCLILIAVCLLYSCGKKGDPTLKAFQKPTSPSGLSAIHLESEIILTWVFPKKMEAGIKEFILMKASDGEFKEIAVLDSDARIYKDTNFKTGNQYTYKIISKSLKGVLGNDSNLLSIRPLEVPPPPQNITFNVYYDTLTLNWESAGENIRYNIYKSHEKGIYNLVPLNKEPIRGNSFKDTFDISKTVYYTLRSLRGTEIRDEGPASEELIVNPSEFIPSEPRNIRAVTGKEKVYLVWTEPPETWVTGYKVYRKTENETNYVLIGETQIPAFVDEEKPDQKRSYRITALGPSKEGPPAEIRNVIFVPER